MWKRKNRPERDQRLHEVQRLLSGAPAPTPWSFKSLPGVPGFEWNLVGATVLLCRGGVPVLALPYYWYVGASTSDSLTVWRFDADHFTIQVLDLSGAMPIAVSDEIRNRDAVFAGDKRDHIELQTMNSGRHSVPSVRSDHLSNEMLLLGKHVPNETDRGAECAIYCYRPSVGEVTVHPQLWFTSERFDIGYAWVTSVERDPIGGRIVGCGIRVPVFQLDAAGTQIERSWGDA